MKRLKKWMSIIMVLAMVVAFMPLEAKNADAATLKIKNVTNGKRAMYVGSVYQIKTNVAKATYKSSKTKVADVNTDGLVTAKKAGKTVITITNTATGKSAKLKVTVKKAKGFTVSKKSGTYTGTQTVKVKSKKGYTVYYSTSGKFKTSNKIKSKKSKTFTVKSNTTLMLYVKKNNQKITVKKMNKTKVKSENVVTYKYTINSNTNTTTNNNTTSSNTNTSVVKPVVPTADAADTSSANNTTWQESEIKGDDTATSWDKLNPVYLALSDAKVTQTNSNGTTLTETGVSYSNGIVKITEPGTYILSGKLTNGSVQVKSGEGEYTLILNGVDISSSTTAALYATKKATKLTVTLAEGSTNTLNGPSAFTFEEGEDEPDAVLFAKKALVINGSGKLQVTASTGDAIKCKDQLKIAGGDITVNAQDEGITGKDSFSMCGGKVNITSGGDGIKTNLQEDATLGYVDVTGGTIIINSNGDGIQADTTATFDNASVNITTNYSSGNDSFKGIKAGGTITAADGTTTLAGLVYIKGGTFVLNTIEDSIQSKKDISITGGDITIVSYSDGIQAEYNLTIQGENTVINITTKKNSAYTTITSYKGLKAGTSTDDGNVTSEGTLLIKAGTITVDTTAAGTTSGNTSGDDAVHCNNIMQIDGGKITVAAGDDAFHSDNKLVINNGNIKVTKSYEGIESYEIYLEGGTVEVTSSDDGINAAGGADGSGNAGNGGNPGSWGGMGGSTTSTGTLYIDGGTYTIQAEGDGVDSNGDIYMTGGNMYVYGPTSGGNGIIDYGENNNKFEKSGGLFIGAGTSDMAVYPTCTRGAMCAYSVTGTAGKSCSFNDGTTTYNFTPTKTYKLVIISTPNMSSGTQYALTYNGGSTISATAAASGSGSSQQPGGTRPGGR